MGHGCVWDTTRLEQSLGRSTVNVHPMTACQGLCLRQAQDRPEGAYKRSECMGQQALNRS